MKLTKEARDQNGDPGPKKRRNTGYQDRGNEEDWRILIGNIGTFPHENDGKGKLKMDLLKHLYTSSDSDIIMLSEHNLNTSNITDRPQDIMAQWVENSQGRFTEMKRKEDSTEWNERSRYEDGGTGIVTNRKATAHIIASGEDSRKMGRWNWVTVKGKLNQKTTFISIYKPQKTQ